MNAEDDVLSSIEELIDDQLDHGERRTLDDETEDLLIDCPRQDCLHGPWHGLPKDGCPGSASQGPMPPRAEFRMEWSTDLPEAEKQQIIAAYLGDLELYGCFEKNVEIGLYVGPQYSLGCFYAGEPLPNLLEDESDWVSVPFGPLAEGAWARQAWKTYRTVTSGPRSYTLAPKVTSDVMGLRPGWEHPERQAIRLSWGDNAIVALE